MLSFNAWALDVVESTTATSTVTCITPTEYIDGTPIRDNDLSIRLYINGQHLQTSDGCSFVIANTPVGNNTLYVTAVSAFYSTESAPSNTVEHNIFERLAPNAPSQLNWQ